MLRGLPGIRHKLSLVSFHHLGNISTPCMHSKGPSIFRIGPSNTVFGFSSNITSFSSSRCNLAYLDGMQKCKCTNAEEATHDAFKRHTRHPRGHNEQCKHLESKTYNITQTYHARITRRQHYVFIRNQLKLSYHRARIYHKLTKLSIT